MEAIRLSIGTMIADSIKENSVDGFGKAEGCIRFEQELVDNQDIIDLFNMSSIPENILMTTIQDTRVHSPITL